MLAKGADQSLGHDCLDRAGDQKRLHSHVDQTGVSRCRVVGVQGAEDQMPGERGLNGVFGGFQVADFADQNDIGVVPQNAAQGSAEGQSDFGMDLNLVDAVELIFDRVFGGDDFCFVVADFQKGAVERGGFSGTGRSSDQDDAVRQFNQLPKSL